MIERVVSASFTPKPWSTWRAGMFVITKKRLPQLVIWGVLVFGAAAYYGIESASTALGSAMVALVVAVLVIAFWMALNFTRIARNKPAREPRTMTFSSNGIELVGVNVETRLAWDAVVRVYPRSAGWVILIAKSANFYYLPFSAVSSTEDRVALMTLFREHGKVSG